MGAVWLATDERLRRPVAIKQPVLDGTSTDRERLAARARLRSEARLTARVDHPGTVRIHGLAEEARRTLDRHGGAGWTDARSGLRTQGARPVGQMTGLGLWLLEVLAATHRAGVVHRDVKPGNVRLCGGGRVVLTDFGIATTIQGGPSDGNGRVSGSPAYMAPEQVQSDNVEPASDLFSLGATLYTAVEGRSPSPRAARRPPSPPSSMTRRRRSCAPARSARSSRGCSPRTRHGGWTPIRRAARFG